MISKCTVKVKAFYWIFLLLGWSLVHILQSLELNSTDLKKILAQFVLKSEKQHIKLTRRSNAHTGRSKVRLQILNLRAALLPEHHHWDFGIYIWETADDMGLNLQVLQVCRINGLYKNNSCPMHQSFIRILNALCKVFFCPINMQRCPPQPHAI